jgi:hypothetical protein
MASGPGWVCAYYSPRVLDKKLRDLRDLTRDGCSRRADYLTVADKMADKGSEERGAVPGFVE